MAYTFDTYKEGYIQDQFKIGSLKYDKWRMGGQTRIPQLEASYSSEGFDPETRFYAFENEKMVAFSTASDTKKEGKKEAFFEFPYYLPGHKAVVDPLVKFAFEKLKSKGFETLKTRAGPYWGNTGRLSEYYGFYFVEDIARGGSIQLDEFDERKLEEPRDVIDYDYERDIEELAQIFAEKYGVSVENMKQNLARNKDLKIGESIKNPWDQKLILVSNVVARVDSKLVGRGVVFNVESFGSKTANLVSFHVEDDDQFIKDQLIRKVVQDCRKQEYHRLVIHTGLWGLYPDDDYFSKYGVEFHSKLAYYHKDL